MNPILWPYLAGTTLIYGLLAVPLRLIVGRRSARGEEIAERLGGYPVRPRRPGRDRLWIQAVSVGEVRLAALLIDGLLEKRPSLEVILSTGTRAGREEAKRLLKNRGEVVYFPVDAPPAVGRAFRRLNPDAVVILETELWPAFLHRARQRGVGLALVNGRISDRTDRVYRRLAPFFRPLMAQFKAVAALSDKDARRLIRLGAPAERTVVTGNAKADRPADGADENLADRLIDQLGLADRPVWVVGSVRGAEVDSVIEAFLAVRQDQPEAILVLAPRHLNRVAKIGTALREAGLDYQLRTGLGPEAPRRAPVVIVDTMGELFALYKAARAVFVGGSLVPLGGQNPLEAAYWGKPVLFGPHMADFAVSADRLLASGGAETVADATALAGRVAFYLAHPDRADQAGRAAAEVVRRGGGAVDRDIDLILQLLTGC